MADRRTVRFLLPSLIALPFALRVFYFLETRGQPYFQWNFLVAYVNHQLAADLALGRGAPYALYRSPYYPLLVSWIYRFAGIDPMAVRVVQWILGGCGCLLVYLLGRRLLGARPALAALAAASLFVPAIWSEGELLEQSCATFFVLAGVTVLAWDPSLRPGPARCLAGSILFGVGFLMRPDLLLGAPFVAAALVLSSGPRGPRGPHGAREISGAPEAPGGWLGKARRAGLFAAGCTLMLALLLWPGLLINVRENDTGINAAINLYLGNNAQADGHDAVLPEMPELPTDDPAARADHMTGLDLAGVRYAMARTGGGLDGVAAYWRGRTVEFIAGHPVAWLKLMGRKLVLFFDGYLIGTQKDLYFMRDGSVTLRALLWCAGLCVPLGLLLPLAVTGAAAAPMTAATRLLLLSVPLGCLMTTLLFFHDARFLLPAAPFLILLAVPGVIAAIGAIRSRRVGAPALLAAALLISNVDWFGTHVLNRASEEFRAGTMYLEAGGTAEAMAAYRRAIEADPAYVPAVENFVYCATATGSIGPALAFLQGLPAAARDTPPVVRARARLQDASGRSAEADETLRDGVARHPGDGSLALDLAERLMHRGGEREALELARGVLGRTAAAHDDARAAAIAGYCLGALGRNPEAVTLLEDGLRRHPDDPAGLSMLGLLGEALGRLGRREEEQRCYREVLARDPGHAVAAYQMARSLAAQEKYQEALVYARLAERLGHPGAAALAGDLASRSGR